MKKGSKMSLEAIQKMRNSKKNISEETRRKMSKAKKGIITWNKGLTKDDPRVANNTRGGWYHSRKSKYAMHKARIGRIPWNKGLTKNDPRVEKYASQIRGIPKTENTKKKISLSRSGYVSYNKGLTKETSEIVRKYSESGSKTIKNQYVNGRKTWNAGLTKEQDNRLNGGLRKGTILGPRPKDVKEKIRVTQKGRTFTDEHRNKLSVARIKMISEGKIDMKHIRSLQTNMWNKGLTKNDHPSIMKYAVARREYANPYWKIYIFARDKNNGLSYRQRFY